MFKKLKQFIPLLRKPRGHKPVELSSTREEAALRSAEHLDGYRGRKSAVMEFISGSPLRNKFLLFFIVLASAPLLVLGALSLYLIGMSHREDISNLELQLIDQKIEEIEKFFTDTLGILELRVGFTQKSEIELSQQKFLLEGLLEENQAFGEVSFINLSGRESAKKLRGENETELQDLSRLEKFKLPAAGKNYISGVYHTLEGPAVTLAAPVRNRNGDVIQVLAAEVNLTSVRRSIEASILGSSGYLVLLDRDGSLVVTRSPGGRPGSDMSGIGRVERVLGGEILTGLDSRDRYESFFGKTSVVGAGKKIPGTGWAVLVEWPVEDADAIVRDIRNQVVLLTLFSILAVLLIAPIFASRLVEPIHQLEEGAFQIGEGNFEKRVRIDTRDELEELGEAFNKMAQGLQRLQELKNEFVFIAAHELRTPVTAIKGYLSMIREGSAGKLSDTMKEFIEPVWRANDRLIQLVNDILEIARSEAGRMKIEVSPASLRESIEAILVELKPLAEEKRVSISYDATQDLPQILADPARLKEIVTNLVSNAIKYNRAGGRVKIYYEIEPQFVVTHVEDNGIGMSQEAQKHLFEKFFRAETREVRSVTGTGLGLFITKELVEKMNGKIWFRSEEGRGSRFSFSLPRVK